MASLGPCGSAVAATVQKYTGYVVTAQLVVWRLLATDAPNVAGRVFNVATGGSTTLLELVAAVNELLGTRIAPTFAPPRTGDVRQSMADIYLARELLGYEPRIGFREGLRLSIEYYRTLVEKSA